MKSFGVLETKVWELETVLWELETGTNFLFCYIIYLHDELTSLTLSLTLRVLTHTQPVDNFLRIAA
jgi:hypothetical protein